MLGRASPPCANSPLRCEFTAHLRRGPGRAVFLCPTTLIVSPPSRHCGKTTLCARRQSSPGFAGSSFQKEPFGGVLPPIVHPDKTETSQAIPKQTVPSKAVASPNFPSPHLLPRWGRTNPSSKTQASKTIHPPIPPQRNHFLAGISGPACLPPVDGSTRGFRASTMPHGKPPRLAPVVFFRPLFF